MVKNASNLILLLALLSWNTWAESQQSWQLSSPNQKLSLHVSLQADSPVYALKANNESLLNNSQLDIKFKELNQLFSKQNFISASISSQDNWVKPRIKQKSERIRDAFKQLTLKFKQDFAIEFRVYNEGMAYRFTLPTSIKTKVINEIVNLNFSKDFTVYAPLEKGFYSHNERSYEPLSLSALTNKSLMSLPTLVASKSHKIVITETGLENYSGLWLTGSEGNQLQGSLPKKITKARLKPTSDRNQVIEKRADYIANIDGSITNHLPWRIFAISQQDTELLVNQLTYLLAPAERISQGDWIKPGKVAWDWWNANNLYGVDFKAGINTETYEYFIDFAAEYNLEYVILDEGWYELGDALAIKPEVDVQRLIEYGKKRGVGIILWVIWETIEQDMEHILAEYARWGAKGIKVDFMQRDDQDMVNYYWQVAEVAAENQLLVNFHGSYKPAGLRRAYPNVITREGVRGLEHNKWASYITSEHNLTLPFIRMVAGPMDYTPGAITNTQPENFHISFERPMSQTTRAHQVAMYVIYDSPLQMLADSPTQYQSAAKTTSFIASVPTVWDETKAISAKLGEHVVMARRLGNTWFLAAMGNNQAHTFKVELDFLGQGEYQMTRLQDGPNADRFASDVNHSVSKVHAEQTIELELAKNGGWVARFEKQ